MRLSAALAAAVRPSLVGAGYVLALVAWTAKRALADQRVLGVESGEITSAITTHFGDHVSQSAGLLVTLALASGAALGVVAGALVRLRDAAAMRETSLGVSLSLRALPGIAALHAASVLYGMAVRPAPYADAFYERGGVRRLVQVTATDVLGPRGVVVVVLVCMVAYVLGDPRRVGRRLGNLAWHARRRAAAGIAMALGALVAWLVLRTPVIERAPRDERPNVLVLAADSLRADRVAPRTAPRLAALADESAVFERAYVSLPRTFPSWVTLMTGRYPHHHGIRTMFPSREARAKDLDALPRRLARAGYATQVVSDYAGDVFPRIELGFGRVDTPTFHFGELVRQRALEAQVPLLPLLGTRLGATMAPSVRGMGRMADAPDVARRTLAAIDAAGDRPFFTVAFFSTAHFPYAAPSPGYGRFTDRAYRGRYKYEKQNRLGRETPPDEADVAQIRGLYDGAVSVIDEAAGTVLDGLAERGLSRRTIVIVTADHGETLFEAGRGHGHGDHLFGEEVLRVPLIVHDGRRPQAKRIGGIARDVDLAATVYALTGTTPPGDLDGASLAPALGGAPLTTPAAFAETGLWFTEEPDGVPPSLRLPYPDVSRLLEVVRSAGEDVVLQDAYVPLTLTAKHRAIVTATHKLVLAPTRQGLRAMLFDIVKDPGCTVDLAAEQPDVTTALREQLLAWVLEDAAIELRAGHLVARRFGEVRADEATFRLEAAP